MSTLILSPVKRCVGGLVLAGLLASCGGGSEGPSQQLYVIKFPHVTAPGTPKGQTAARFEDLAEARFPGRVDVEVYPSSQLMNDDDSLEALAFGEIQMIAVSLSKFDRLTEKFQVFDLPFLFSDLESVERFQASPTGKILLTELVDKCFGQKLFPKTFLRLTLFITQRASPCQRCPQCLSNIISGPSVIGAHLG